MRFFAKNHTFALSAGLLQVVGCNDRVVGFRLANAVKRNANVYLINQAANGLGLHETDAKTDEVNQILAVDIPKIPGCFADTFKDGEYGQECR